MWALLAIRHKRLGIQYMAGVWYCHNYQKTERKKQKSCWHKEKQVQQKKNYNNSKNEEIVC
jgi:hypothetical protein